jgi:hypothetical protein
VNRISATAHNINPIVNIRKAFPISPSVFCLYNIKTDKEAAIIIEIGFVIFPTFSLWLSGDKEISNIANNKDKPTMNKNLFLNV